MLSVKIYIVILRISPNIHANHRHPYMLMSQSTSVTQKLHNIYMHRMFPLPA